MNPRQLSIVHQSNPSVHVPHVFAPRTANDGMYLEYSHVAYWNEYATLVMQERVYLHDSSIPEYSLETHSHTLKSML